MVRGKKIAQNFIIDRLTNSILNTISGDSFQTEIILLNKFDLKKITKKKGWNFEWKTEFSNLKKEVYKLTIEHNSNIIQGLVSISIETDHIHIDLLESAPFNIGTRKIYEGVAGNLVAFACKLSFQKGLEGYVAFTAKTELIEHYQKTLGAIHFKNKKMILESKASKILVEKYFKN